MKIKSFPEIKTERLSLRKIEELDCDNILFLRSDVTVNKFIERPENRKTRNKTDAIKFIKEINEAFDKNKSISWGITLKNNPKVIGTICLWNFSENKKTAEVGYDLDPEYQRIGIMNEALNSIIDFGFNKLKLDTIEAFTHKENENSKKLLAKNEFVFMELRTDLENDLNMIFELKNASS
jgi:ribosomal-protein-alanine N-acetyltransferase